MKTGKELYQDLVIDHGKAPRNEGLLEGATHEATAKNPLCGDRVTLRLDVGADGIGAARFEARGCMIAKASASLLTEAVRGRTVAGALALGVELEAAIEPGGADRPMPAALEALSGAREFPARRACVLLPWKALRSALDGYIPTISRS